MKRIGKRAMTVAERSRRYRRRLRGLVYSSHRAGNDRVFADIAHLYFPPGSRIADPFHGRGTFWRKIPAGTYEVLATDLMDGIDARHLPYPDASLDGAVLDPPYQHSSYGTLHRNRGDDRYNNNLHGMRTQAEVFKLYLDSSREAWRVLRPGGVLVVKCQDAVENSKQTVMHVDLVNALRQMGYRVEDVIAVTPPGRPTISRLKEQRHARKNHSYFLVFRRP